MKSVGSSNTKGTLSCWLCNGPHRAAQCPHKSKLSALQSSLAQEEQGGEEEEKECQMGALSLQCPEEAWCPKEGSREEANVCRRHVKWEASEECDD